MSCISKSDFTITTAAPAGLISDTAIRFNNSLGIEYHKFEDNTDARIETKLYADGNHQVCVHHSHPKRTDTIQLMAAACKANDTDTASAILENVTLCALKLPVSGEKLSFDNVFLQTVLDQDKMLIQTIEKMFVKLVSKPS